MADLDILINPFNNLDIDNLIIDSFEFYFDGVKSNYRKLDQLIENRTPIRMNIPYSNSPTTEFGIILNYNSELLFTLSSDFHIYFTKIDIINHIYSVNDIDGYLFSKKVNLIFEKNIIFNNTNFLEEIPTEIKKKIKKLVNYDYYELEYINLSLKDTFEYFKQNNFIIVISSNSYNNDLVSKVISVGNNKIEVMILDSNGILLSENETIQFDDLEYFYFQPEVEYHKNTFDRKNLLNETINKCFPGLEFTNEFIEIDSYYDNWYVIKGENISCNISKIYVDKIKFLSEHYNYIVWDSNYTKDKNNLNFTPQYIKDAISMYSVSLKMVFDLDTIKEKFLLVKLFFKDRKDSDEFDNILILSESERFILAKHISEDFSGYSIINKKDLIDRVRVYVNKEKKFILEREKIIPKNILEIKENLDKGIEDFSFLENKFCYICKDIIRPDTDDLSKAEEMNCLILVKNSMGTILEGNMTTFNYILFPKKTVIDISNFTSINFDSKYLLDYYDNYNFIKSEEINIKQQLEDVNTQIMKSINKIIDFNNLKSFYSWNIIKFEKSDFYCNKYYIEILNSEDSKNNLSISFELNDDNIINNFVLVEIQPNKN